jgi:hypothetical protein
MTGQIDRRLAQPSLQSAMNGSSVGCQLDCLDQVLTIEYLSDNLNLKCEIVNWWNAALYQRTEGAVRHGLHLYLN